MLCLRGAVTRISQFLFQLWKAPEKNRSGNIRLPADNRLPGQFLPRAVWSLVCVAISQTGRQEIQKYRARSHSSHGALSCRYRLVNIGNNPLHPPDVSHIERLWFLTRFPYPVVLRTRYDCAGLFQVYCSGYKDSQFRVAGSETRILTWIMFPCAIGASPAHEGRLHC